MVNFGLLAAEIILGVWGTPANFNGFRVLASLLHRLRSTEVNQTLHDVWLSSALVHYIYISRGSCPLMEFSKLFTGAEFTLHPSLAFSCIGSVTARHLSSGREPNFAALSREHHLYSAGWPSCWASAHILVCSCVVCFCCVRFAYYVKIAAGKNVSEITYFVWSGRDIKHFKIQSFLIISAYPLLFWPGESHGRIWKLFYWVSLCHGEK